MEPCNTTTSSPRISFSADFLDGDEEEEEKDFISISPNWEKEKEKVRNVAADFEFLSSKKNSESMITADELFFEGKLLPFWQMQQQCEKLSKMSLKLEKHGGGGGEEAEMEEQISKSKEENSRAVSWFLDDDPSPRPPKCTVLWKELLRLRKQRSSSSLSPSSSTSSSSSSGSSLSGGDENKERQQGRDKNVKMRVKKGLERTRSATIRVRPVINVPICTQGKTTSALPPIFSSFKKASKLER
ncbi:uncharacterized protein LOC116017290 [Ipomoea triloba]|uniref:uncharacterized protein LOC116017290 n=1 Tax=Ipomoea triloba TaxID=35885 RepID=UPI00125D09D6|nr:uncharacterized protein LOC116017290 [Ipomoea triloba]